MEINETSIVSLEEREDTSMHWGMGFWPLLPLLWIVFLVCIVGGIVRWAKFGGRRGAFYGPGMPAPEQPSALEILSQRYARGEIDSETFDQMRERLESVSRPRYP
jgi:putative membrane protein